MGDECTYNGHDGKCALTYFTNIMNSDVTNNY